MENGYIEVEIGEKTRTMKFGFNALADIEEHFGKGISVVMSEENIGFRTIRALYWAGLRWKDKGLTIERVGHMLEGELENGKTFKELMEPVKKALQAARIFSRKTEESADEEEGEEDSPN